MKHWAATLAIGFILGIFLLGNSALGQNGLAEPASYRAVVKKVLPAVVSIEVRAKVKAEPPAPVPFDGPAFGEIPAKDFGSGFLIAPAGTVVTSLHIVRGAESVVVRLHDGRKFISRDIRGDPRSDLAVIKIDPKGAPLPVLELGDSDAMEIGDRVLAVGAPFGLVGSVTHGIVSGKGRDLNLSLYEDFLQTDAAINPGNSGGPLVNLAGKVVGINAAIKSRSGGFQGIGLAVASNLAKGVIEALRTEGVVHRAYLGVQARVLDADVAPRLGVPKGAGGIVVGQVFANTPAAKAGLLAGDVLTKIDGKAVGNPKTLQRLVARLPIGKTVPIELIRDSKLQTADCPVAEQPAAYAAAGVPAPRGLPPGVPSVAVAKLGLDVADLPPGLARDLGYPAGARGVLVTRVQSGNLAADAELRAGMLITKIDGKTADDAASARQTLEAASLKQGVVLQVQSPQGGVTYVLLQAEAPDR